MDVRIDPEVSRVVVAGTPVEVHELLLGGVPRGAAVVVAGPDGLSEIEAVDTMNSLAQHGYESLLARPADDAAEDDVDRAVVHHLVDRLAARGWTHEQTGVIGYGRGARAALVAGADTTFGAAISIPRDPRVLLTPDRITGLCTPWLGLVGLGPHREPTGELAVYRDEMRTASSEHTSLIGYPGVAHCLRDSTDALEHQAAFDAWQRTAEWMNIHVVPRPTPLAKAWRARQTCLQPTSH